MQRQPIVPAVMRPLRPQQHPYTLPPLEILATHYHTPTTVRIERGASWRQDRCWCVPNDAARQQLENCYAALGTALQGLDTALGTLPLVRERLKTLEERRQKKGRLSRFVIRAPLATDTLWGQEPWHKPEVAWCWCSSHRPTSLYLRPVTAEEAAGMANLRPAAGEVLDRECRLERIHGQRVCRTADQGAAVQALADAVTTAWDAWQTQLATIGTYTEALADDRHRSRLVFGQPLVAR